MYFVRLKLDGFRAIESADVQFGRGLNVVYGPNDLGKSTLAAALRAALLLPASSTEGQSFVPWHRRDYAPRTVLQFVDDEDRHWRVKKTFGDAPSAELEFTKDDISFSSECSGRGVEDKLRSLLSWGIPAPGGKGGQRGIPRSFLAQALLAEQTDVRKVLEESLEEDKDGSGKLRLIDALKTLAQDPLFKKVLDAAQADYDQFFSGKAGQLKRGKTSPFVKAAEEIKRISDELAEQTKKKEESTSTEARVRGLRAERDALLSDAAEAEAALGRALALRERARERDKLTARREEAQSRLRSIDAELASVEEKRRVVDALRADADSCHHTLEETIQSCALDKRAERDAEEAARRAASDDAARERDLQRAQVENQLASQKARILDAEAKGVRARAAVAAVEAAARAEANRAEAAAVLERIRRSLEAARATLARAREDLRLATGTIAYGRWRACVTAAEESRVAREEAVKKRADAEALQREAASLRDSSSGIFVPTDAEVRATATLRRSLDLAEAALGGGISVVVTPKRSLALRAALDGAWKEDVTVSGATEFEAEGKLELRIDDLVDVRITAGDATRRKEAEVLRARWLLEGAPLLARAGAIDLEALDAHMKTARATAQRIEGKQREIAMLEDSAKNREARITELEPSTNSIREREEALIGLDRVVLESMYTKLGKHWETQAEAIEAKLSRALDAAQGAVAGLDRDMAGHEEGAKHAEAQWSGAVAARDAALASVGSEPTALAENAANELESARKECEALEASLVRLAEDSGRELEQARGALERARAAVKASDARRVAADAAAIAARSRVDRASGELATLQERTATLDRAVAAAAVQSAEVDVARFGSTDGLPTDADIEKARADVEEWTAKLLETTRALDAAVGALEQVGGATLDDKLVDLRAARDNAHNRQRDLDVMAKAGRLLRDKLLEAEEMEGAHLGRALSVPVTERLGELTEGRYGALLLGPTLKAQNIEVLGSGSPEDALAFLSVGTLEQLATLVRVAIAEQLKSAIVLDDHLVQSDRKRLQWFRRMLRRAATHIQVLVLTCRPDDYLDPSETPGEAESTRDVVGGGVRAIDLEKVIRRWQPGSRRSDPPAGRNP